MHHSKLNIFAKINNLFTKISTGFNESFPKLTRFAGILPNLGQMLVDFLWKISPTVGRFHHISVNLHKFLHVVQFPATRRRIYAYYAQIEAIYATHVPVKPSQADVFAGHVEPRDAEPEG